MSPERLFKETNVSGTVRPPLMEKLDAQKIVITRDFGLECEYDDLDERDVVVLEKEFLGRCGDRVFVYNVSYSR